MEEKTLDNLIDVKKLVNFPEISIVSLRSRHKKDNCILVIRKMNLWKNKTVVSMHGVKVNTAS